MLRAVGDGVRVRMYIKQAQELKNALVGGEQLESDRIIVNEIVNSPKSSADAGVDRGGVCDEPFLRRF